MTMPIFDWPSRLIPRRAIVIAPGNTIDGFISRASLENNRMVPGARNQMRMEFSVWPPDTARMAAWAFQNLRRGWFRVPVWNSPQLATSAAIVAAEAAHAAGIPFSTGEFFSTGSGFAFAPTLDVASAVLEGNDEVTLDESRWPDALTYGTVFGLGTGVYHVNALERDGDLITITFSPPARRDIDVGEFVSLRPKMLCKPADLNTFISLFESVGNMQPGPITMNEAIEETYL